jgi:uncharacterized membrane protein
VNPAASAAIAAVFVWLGMTAAISFLEAPLKFRAPGVTRQIGLGIGLLVFHALNRVELALAVVIVVAFVVGALPVGVVVAVVTAVAALAVQLLVLRPRLDRRADKVLAGLDAPRPRSHYAYIGFEVVKEIALAVSGILLLSVSS